MSKEIERAFPVVVPGEGETGPVTYFGMSLRDHFAARAMQGFMSRTLISGFDEEMIAQKSYEMADCMMAERAKQ